MIRKIIFNLIIALILVMIAVAIIRANKPAPGITKASLNSLGEREGLEPREAKYYKVIGE